MIFYFTGTGNSLWAAKELAKALDEPLTSITEALQSGEKEYLYTLREDETVVFVFPVHSWGPAIPVTRFVGHLTLAGYTRQPVYSVCTCGDDCGCTTDMLGKTLLRRGIRLTAGYSVSMPNNYILMAGFDVDTKEVEERKLKEAPARIVQITAAMCERQNVHLYKKGSMPLLKSYLVNPLFVNFVVGRNSFRVTEACISCGICEQACPTKTIRLTNGEPIWTDTCIQCVACIHRCPVRAIEYGKETVKKGRYHHPLDPDGVIIAKNITGEKSHHGLKETIK